MNSTPLYKEIFARISGELKILPDKPEETPESTLNTLWHAAAGEPKSVQLSNESELPYLDNDAVSKIYKLVEQRLAGIPLAHLTGRQRFMGIELLAGREALIPRKETELLGYAALNVLREMSRQYDKTTVVDVCTGSANLACALAFYELKARIFASDISAEAVALASRNVNHLGLESRIKVMEGDLLAPFDSETFYENIDLLTCNPPYISSAKVDKMPEEISKYEPQLAFDGGVFGVKILQRFISEAPRFLRKGGWLAFEVGLGQGSAIMSRLSKDKNFTNLQSVKDEAGEIRALLARKVTLIEK
ncbi:MAG: peptide chain release factor N(5)-glutamine methyltransferase [Nitrospirae bacterium]|nr:peptide chain release factor N(5)-glutamine methyltransferase [Nitrospirota bacterium]